MHVERAADHSGAVLHDADSHAGFASAGGGDADAVVVDRERGEGIDGIQFNANSLGVRMADGVVDGFLGDAEKMQSDRIVREVERSATTHDARPLHGGLDL